MPPVRKLAKIPAVQREWLHRAFVERAFGDIEGITKELNEILAKEGLGITVGKSAVGEESLRVRRAQEAIAATTRSMQLIADTARDDADKRIALLNKAALAAGRLTTTSVRQRKFRHEVEERAKAAAEAVTKIAKRGGLQPDQVREIRAQILGISHQPKSANSSPTPPAAAAA